MPVRVSRASSVIVHQVPPAAADRFLALQDELTLAVEAFPGYQGTDVYPPADPKGTEWVVLIHFTDAAALQKWLDSAERTEGVRKVRREVGEFELKSLPTGFGSWFTGQTAKPANLPPAWKMVMMVVLGLYPTVMLLGWTVGKVTGPLGFAVSMLIGNACSVSILQWIVMPVLTRMFDPWLKANAPLQTGKTVSGGVLILGLLAGLAAFFTYTDG